MPWASLGPYPMLGLAKSCTSGIVLLVCSGHRLWCSSGEVLAPLVCVLCAYLWCVQPQGDPIHNASILQLTNSPWEISILVSHPLMRTWYQCVRRGDLITCISAGGVELHLFGFSLSYVYSWSLYFLLVLFILFIFSILVPH